MRISMGLKPLAALTLLGMASAAVATDNIDFSATQKLYEEHCTVCHGAQRIGGAGPALLPESLGRIKKPEASKAISEGRPASQMAAYKDILSPAQIESMVEYLYTPIENPPTWDDADTRASHRMLVDVSTLSETPLHQADPLNLFVVVEAGTHHVTILDGDKFEPLTRFQSHFALHGGPKFSPDGRFVYFASRDGWVTKYDLYNFTMVAETRVGLNTRNLAVSNDGRWVLAGNYLPGNLVLLNADDLTLVKSIPVIGEDGTASRVSAVYTAPPRDSFIVALKDTKEAWELSYAGTPDFTSSRRCSRNACTNIRISCG